MSFLSHWLIKKLFFGFDVIMLSIFLFCAAKNVSSSLSSAFDFLISVPSSLLRSCIDPG